MDKFVQIDKNELIKINGGGKDDYDFGYWVGYKLGKVYRWITNIIIKYSLPPKGIPCPDVYYG